MRGIPGSSVNRRRKIPHGTYDRGMVYVAGAVTLTLDSDGLAHQRLSEPARRIPLAGLEHYFLDEAAIVNQAESWDAHLIFVFRGAGGERCRCRFEVRAGDPQLGAFLAALDELKPGASLRHLRRADALVRLGLAAPQRLQTILLFWLAVFVAIGLLWWRLSK
jgi:hypothetical protein